MKHYIGVDGGASKTAAIVIDENGETLGRGLAGGSNHLRVGIETATRVTKMVAPITFKRSNNQLLTLLGSLVNCR